jgi:polyisoprenoid-binding protein YceI
MNARALLISALIAFAASASPAAIPSPDPAKPCVAWAASKRLFLFKTVAPIGVNCAVKLEAVPDKAGRRLRVTVPIASFDSGEPERDKKVLEILKAGVQPDLVFLSDPYKAKEWGELRAGKIGTIDGALRIAGADFPVSLSVIVSGGTAIGKIRTSFSALNMSAPTVAGGLVAKVADELELRYRIPLSGVPR